MEAFASSFASASEACTHTHSTNAHTLSEEREREKVWPQRSKCSHKSIGAFFVVVVVAAVVVACSLAWRRELAD